jgi:hypothetical protein
MQHPTTQQTFWTWFLTNEERLFQFERDQDNVFDELAHALADVSPELTFEFGPVEDGRREFIISASGVKSAFPFVETLAAAAPVLPRWKVLKYRQRRSPLMELSINGTTVNPDDVEVALMSNGREIGVRIFFDGYTQDTHQLWGMFGYLFLDQALGEFDVETKLGLIDFAAIDSKGKTVTVPLPKLPELFDMHVAKLSWVH